MASKLKIQGVKYVADSTSTNIGYFDVDQKYLKTLTDKQLINLITFENGSTIGDVMYNVLNTYISEFESEKDFFSFLISYLNETINKLRGVFLGIVDDSTDKCSIGNIYEIIIDFFSLVNEIHNHQIYASFTGGHEITISSIFSNIDKIISPPAFVSFRTMKRISMCTGHKHMIPKSYYKTVEKIKNVLEEIFTD